ncbi:MAG: SHOCT domain-containing protein [Nitrososphaera sp.]
MPWRWGEGYYSYGYPNRDAESVLKERYAKGELTKEQFEQMMLDLKTILEIHNCVFSP